MLADNRSVLEIAFAAMLTCAIFVSCRAHDEAPAGTLDVRIDRLLMTYEDRGVFTGAVLIAKNGNVLLEKGYGPADRDGNRPNTPDTPFQIASTSKLLTRVAVLLEADRGTLNVDDVLSEYIPDIPNGATISLAHLIHNTSGIRDLYNDEPFARASDFAGPITPDELLDLFRDLTPTFEPGTRLGYSSPGYVLLARVVERTSGVAFGSYLQENLFGPLGMRRSGHLGFDVPDDPATGYVREGRNLSPAPDVDPDFMLGAGGVVTSARDLYRLYIGLYEKGLLSERSMNVFGGGLHYGHNFGFRSGFVAMPFHGIAVIVLSNHDEAPMEDLVPEILTILLEGDVVDRDASTLEEYVGIYGAPSFDHIDSEMIIRLDDPGLEMRIDFSTGDMLEFSLRPEEGDRFLTVADGEFTGMIVTFDRDSAERIAGLTVNHSGWIIPAVRESDR
jgi:CubicO group peptidase (beta-lactamase class C family)